MFVFLADRRNADDLQDSHHVWLPLAMEGDTVAMHWREEWELSVFEG